MLEIKEDEALFGELLPYIRDEQITDINYNGSQLWVDHLDRGRYPVRGVLLSDAFLNRLAARLCNAMNVSFNPFYPVLEAESETLRISLLHETVTATGKSLSIRKTPPLKRITEDTIRRGEYCPEKLDVFMEHAVRSGLTTVIAGLPGAGKTEYLKHLTSFIPAHEKVITIEDNLEIHYHRINPGKDCVEIKVGPTLAYGPAIKMAMRQIPRWLLLSEARSAEAEYLLEAMSTGAHCLTTIHADDVAKIPDRFCNMVKKDVLNDFFSFVDVGVLIQAQVLPAAGIRRQVAQLCLFTREQGANRMIPLYEQGKWLDREIPESIRRRMRLVGIQEPFRRGDGIEAQG